MKKAFTLIELSIVLIIIGLLVGGVLAGRELIRATKLAKIPQELVAIDTAINTFQLKYDCLPGDCDVASDFFAAATDGNDNGVINGDSTSGIDENEHMWHHMSLAGLIESLSPVASAGSLRVGGVNLYPTAVKEGASYLFRDGSVARLYGRDGVKIMLGDMSSSYPIGSLLSNVEARSVDLKMDDGLASGGEVYATNGAAAVGSCTTADYTDSPPSDYSAANDGISCRLFFWRD